MEIQKFLKQKKHIKPFNIFITEFGKYLLEIDF